MEYDDEDYEDFEDEDDGVQIMIGADGKASIYNPDDYVEMRAEDAEIFKGFIEENKEAFAEYVKKHKPTEKEDNVRN